MRHSMLSAIVVCTPTVLQKDQAACWRKSIGNKHIDSFGCVLRTPDYSHYYLYTNNETTRSPCCIGHALQLASLAEEAHHVCEKLGVGT